MKVIIVGLGKFGRKVLQLLVAEKHDVVAIDKDAEKIQTIVDKYDVMGLCGNGCMAENLKEAGAENADMLIAVTPSDEQNVLCSLIAKNLGVKSVMARVRDPEYNEQADFMREKFGIDRFFNPEKAVSEEITRVIRFPSAERIFSFADGAAEIVETKLHASSPLIGKKLKEIGSKEKNYAVLVVAIERGGKVIVPNGETELMEGDIVSICAKRMELCEFLKAHGLLKKTGLYVMILGADRMSHYLARNLVKYGFRVKVISPNAEKCKAIGAAIPEISVICDNFSDKDVLETEGIEDADAVVATTAYDENNIMISLFAKNTGVNKTVTVLRNESYLGIVSGLELDTVISPYEVVAEDAVKYLRSLSIKESSKIRTMYKIAGEKAEALLFDVNGNRYLSRKALKDLKLKSGVLVTAIIRGKTLVIPKGATIIEEKDSIIVVSSPDCTIFGLDDIIR